MNEHLTAEELVENFELFDNWEDRYRYVIDLGRALEPLPESAYSDENKVRGCTSQVWMISKVDPGPPPRLELRADSDSHLVKGLAAILMALYSGRTRDEIAALDIEATFARLGLSEHLSPNRRSGFFAMVERIRLEAAALAEGRAQ